MNDNYRCLLKTRTANAAIGASTIRGMAPGGAIIAARAFLGGIDLRRFIKDDDEAFKSELGRATSEYEAYTGLGWGPCRKFLNIFLRDCLYNKWVREDYELERVEGWLEVPLDSHVAKGIKREFRRRSLPAWKGVVGLHPKDSEKYQAAAAGLAEKDGVARVHLDLRFWRQK